MIYDTWHFEQNWTSGRINSDILPCGDLRFIDGIHWAPPRMTPHPSTMCRPPIRHIIATRVPLDDQLYATSPPSMRQVIETHELSFHLDSPPIFRHFVEVNARASSGHEVTRAVNLAERAGSLTLRHPPEFFAIWQSLTHENLPFAKS